MAAGLIDRTNFVPQYPFKHSATGDLDLRTVLTSDGEETLYDRWNKLFHEQLPMDAIEAILSSAAPEGTFKQKGMKVQQLQQILQTTRDSAFMILQSQERRIIESTIRDQVYKAQTEAGLWDAERQVTRPQVPESPWSK